MAAKADMIEAPSLDPTEKREKRLESLEELEAETSILGFNVGFGFIISRGDEWNYLNDVDAYNSIRGKA